MPTVVNSLILIPTTTLFLHVENEHFPCVRLIFLSGYINMVFSLSFEQKSGRKLPPGQSVTDRILRWGTDHPGIVSVNPRIQTATYTLTMDGEVENPVRLSWSDVLTLPRTVSVSDFHCVEGWSVLNCRWEGVRFKDLERLVKPKPTAQAATFECADGYTTSLFLSELAGDDVLLAYKLNDEYLEEGLGFPLRLIVPSKYAYKSALWVTGVHFSRGKELGFWERRGYSDSADVWKNDRFRK
jgi:DMSO/TMAO reductase YedYZ molybdopterin-dependent catalytic subunit